MGYNKKVRNATKLNYDNLQFDSKLELFCYKYFKDNNITLKRESVKIQLLPGFTSKVKLFLPQKRTTKTKSAQLLKEFANKKIVPITYTPDFVLHKNNIVCIIEVKGKPNDVYPYKRKLLLHLLTHNNSSDKEYYFFEPHSQTQIKQMFNIINEL